MTDAYRDALAGLSRVPGVRGALLALADAGVPVAEELQPGVSGSAIAALAAALFRRTSMASESGGLGALETVQVEAEAGQVHVAGAGNLIVIALVTNDAQIGRVRMELLRAAQAVRQAAEADAS
ncbi:MAG: roadblock/LC7 domain-containing protein [Gemmatimonadetes bacterium]|nr:roadblock/LC7 domain-containing protein [Gemmatimonadota bacterium]